MPDIFHRTVSKSTSLTVIVRGAIFICVRIWCGKWIVWVSRFYTKQILGLQITNFQKIQGCGRHLYNLYFSCFLLNYSCLKSFQSRIVLVSQAVVFLRAFESIFQSLVAMLTSSYIGIAVLV